MQHMTSPEINPWLLDSLTWQERRLPSEFSSWLNFNSKPEEIWRDKRIYIYIYIHFFHKLQFLWFCFLIFLSPSDAIYSSLLSLPLSWVAWVHWRHVSHEAPVAVQLQFLPEPPGVQAIGIGEGARKCKGEYDKKDQQRSKHMQDRQECNAEIWWNDLSLAGLRRKPARFASGALSINLRNLGKPPFSVHLAPWTTTTSTFDIDPLSCELSWSPSVSVEFVASRSWNAISQWCALSATESPPLRRVPSLLPSALDRDTGWEDVYPLKHVKRKHFAWQKHTETRVGGKGWL